MRIDKRYLLWLTAGAVLVCLLAVGYWVWKLPGTTKPGTVASLIPVENKNGKWGAIDPVRKKLAIEYRYDWLDSFTEGMARMSINGRMGVVSNTGSVVIP